MTMHLAVILSAALSIFMAFSEGVNVVKGPELNQHTVGWEVSR